MQGVAQIEFLEWTRQKRGGYRIEEEDHPKGFWVERGAA